MQEIKTICRPTTLNEDCAAFDTEVNAMLQDGWTILQTAIATTSEDAASFTTVVMIRETTAPQPAPAETPHVWHVGDTAYFHIQDKAFKVVIDSVAYGRIEADNYWYIKAPDGRLAPRNCSGSKLSVNP